MREPRPDGQGPRAPAAPVAAETPGGSPTLASGWPKAHPAKPTTEEHPAKGRERRHTAQARRSHSAGTAVNYVRIRTETADCHENPTTAVYRQPLILKIHDLRVPCQTQTHTRYECAPAREPVGSTTRYDPDYGTLPEVAGGTAMLTMAFSDNDIADVAWTFDLHLNMRLGFVVMQRGYLLG